MARSSACTLALLAKSTIGWARKEKQFEIVEKVIKRNSKSKNTGFKYKRVDLQALRVIL